METLCNKHLHLEQRNAFQAVQDAYVLLEWSSKYEQWTNSTYTNIKKGLDRVETALGRMHKTETNVTRRLPVQTLTQSRDRQGQHMSTSVCSNMGSMSVEHHFANL